jgi:folate-binding protein YgfZ
VTRSAVAEPRAGALPRLAHRFRDLAVLSVEGADRAAFLQGQLTQEVRDLRPGASRLTAGLTPQGKLLYYGRLVAEADRFLLILDSSAAGATREHLIRYAAFQKVAVSDASPGFVVASLYGPRGPELAAPEGGWRLSGWGEISAEIVAPAHSRAALERLFEAEGSAPISEAHAEILRIEAGRPALGRDAGPGNLPQEVGLADAIAPNKGCYVGQEVVARLKTYGKVQRRLSGFRFPEGPVAPGTAFPNPEKPSQELARITSSVVSPRFGPIGLGLAFRGVAEGSTLSAPGEGPRIAVVSALPFS